MDEIDLGVGQQIFVAGIAFLDPQGLTDLVEPLSVSLADGIHSGVGVFLVDGDELGPKAQADNGHVHSFLVHKGPSSTDFPPIVAAAARVSREMVAPQQGSFYGMPGVQQPPVALVAEVRGGAKRRKGTGSRRQAGGRG